MLRPRFTRKNAGLLLFTILLCSAVAGAITPVGYNAQKHLVQALHAALHRAGGIDDLLSAPGPIGGGTPAVITGTTVTAATQFIGSCAGCTNLPGGQLDAASVSNAKLANPSITVNGAAVALGTSIVVVPGLTSIYGDGSDGAAVLDGTNTVAWASKVSNTYMMTRDANLTTLTVTAARLVTNGYRGRNTVSVTNNSFIDNNGNQAGGSAGGAAGPGGTLGTGTAGSNGVINNSAGNPVNVIDSLGGQGGNGGAGGVNTGGTAPVITAPIASRGLLRGFPQNILGHFIGNGAVVAIRAGGGGAGGGSNNVGATGGGGGGGAGAATWATPIWTGNPLTCNGGNGAAGTASAGAAGGGGGGGGGVCILVSPAGVTPTAAGGSGGAGAGGGISGSAGAAGTALLLN